MAALGLQCHSTVLQPSLPWRTEKIPRLFSMGRSGDMLGFFFIFVSLGREGGPQQSTAQSLRERQ